MAGLFPQFHQPVLDCVYWHGASRTAYETQNHAIGTVYLARAGIYIFCRQLPNGNWYPIYLGETDNFSRRLTDERRQHHAWNCIVAAGATHICTLHVTGGLLERLKIETDLRHCLNPCCNRQ